MLQENIFDGAEFERWAYMEGLSDREKFLIEKYLSKEGATLEAGTGAGRILIEMKRLGFDDLHGFDLSGRMIGLAKGRVAAQGIQFKVQDASKLDYEDSSFDQALYLQQVLCFIDHEKDRCSAFREAYRVVSKGGVVIFSFLCFDGRFERLSYRAFLVYINFLRRVKRCRRSLQSLPWIKNNKKLNFKVLIDRGPYNYWFRSDEVVDLLRSIGFDVIFVCSDRDAAADVSESSLSALKKSHALYVVCRK
ncbi:class I SAM-dependent methyltransferase [Halomonas organivorans]|uniref:SAM-dependent methyltransferase n=1 Tax=Halomonas organivorans TaxID=257772 RepID=A0A7W5BXK6_9GAMM|nr:class I SAM-dependent methyltransferase [Halomonas organivorans]MBB3140053.1 SAM-dependent methyltransferase [Halomonas organivorans]